MNEVPPIVRLRENMSFVHSLMSVLMRTGRGRKGDLSPVACGILYTAYFHEIKMTDVSERFKISKSTATDYINNLEKRGFVERVRGEDDRRDVFIKPAPAGSRWILERECDVFSFLDSRLCVLDKGEQETFVRLLSKFTGYGNGEDHEIVLEQMIHEAAEPCSYESSALESGCERVEDMVRRRFCGRSEKKGD